MAFQIPNDADAAFTSQAAPDKGDFDIIAAGLAGTGVISGCAVTAQGSPDMTLAVAAGTVRVAGVPRATVTAGNVTITTADATNPRFDLVVVSSTGVKSVTAGAPAATPAFPAIPANSVVLAAVYVPANDTAIGTTQIIDKRVMLTTTQQLHVRHETAAGTGGTTGAGTFTAGAWQVRVLNTVLTNEIAGASLSANEITLPAGRYRIDASAPAWDVGAHKARLWDVTGAQVLVVGTNAWQSSADSILGLSHIRGTFTLTAQANVRIEHHAQTTANTLGLGVDTGITGVVEVHTDCVIEKID